MIYQNRYFRILASCLVVALCCSFCVFAVDKQNGNNSCSYSAETSTVIEATSNTMNILNSDNQTVHAKYSYDLTPQKENPDLAEANIALTLTIGEQVAQITASGPVNAYMLNSGDVLWEGPLDGSAFIDNVSFPAIVGFAKMNSQKEIQMSVTIQPYETAIGEEEMIPIVYLVGESVVNADLVRATAANEPQEHANAIAKASDKLERKGSHITSSNASYIYWNSRNNRLGVSVQSFTNNINRIYAPKGYSVDSLISKATIELKRVGTGSSYIAGMEKFGFSSFNKSVSLHPLLADAMGMIGIPTSTIESFLNGLNGTVSKTEYTNDSTVELSFGLLQYVKFDSNEVPIIFQLAKSGSSIGSTNYKGITKIRYRVEIIPKGSSMYYTYHDSATATADTNVTPS